MTESLTQTAGARPGQVDREFTVRGRSQWQQAMRRFLRHRLAVGRSLPHHPIQAGTHTVTAPAPCPTTSEGPSTEIHRSTTH
jgi:hypothetical protein